MYRNITYQCLLNYHTKESKNEQIKVPKEIMVLTMDVSTDFERRLESYMDDMKEKLQALL